MGGFDYSKTYSDAALHFISKFVNSLITRDTNSRISGLPRSGKNIWKMKFFPGQGKVREFCGWSGKFRKKLESQGKVREFENKWLWQADLFCARGENMYFLLR